MNSQHTNRLLGVSVFLCGCLLITGMVLIYRSILALQTSHERMVHVDWILIGLMGCLVFLAVIIYRSIRSNARLEEKLSGHNLDLEATLKEVSDYKYALDESAIVAITDQKGIIKHVNDNFLKISKYTKAELIGKDHRIINSGYHPKEFIRELWSTISNGRIWKGELRNRAKDGTIYWVDTTIVPFLNEVGKPYQYVAIRSDIAERKKAEADLRTSLREVSDYKYALDESSIVAITDQKGIIQYVNDNFCKISKYSREELLGQDHRIINSDYHPKEFIRELWVTIARGKIWKGELKNKAKDGTIYWVDTTIVPFLNESGKPYQYVAIRSDITLQKEAEEKLIRNERIYKAVASNIPGSVICLLDPAYRYFLVEGDILEKLGFSKGMLIGKKPDDILPEDQYSKFKDELERAFRGEVFSVETKRLDYILLSRYVPLKDDAKNIYAVMIIVLDITDLKKAENHIAELNAGLEKKINERTQQLESANKELEAFSYSVAHDLRTPLRAVAGYSTMIAEDYTDKLDAEGKRLLKELQYNTEKMGKLIDDLLTFSRLGRKPITKSTVDMRAVIASVQEDIGWHDAKIIMHNLHPIVADASLIRHVMVNLLSNAVKYSSKAKVPCVEISSEHNDHAVTYSVRDNGVGFDMEYAGKLFGVFQRLHPDEEFDGTGVGLAIVQRIVTRHGGKVWAQAKVNEGATFYFTIPDEDTHNIPEIKA